MDHNMTTAAEKTGGHGVEALHILPLIDWFTASEKLTGEAGVSYLLRTGEATILFDVGFNPSGEHPSALLRNMKELGVELESIDALVISHLHLDHVGGIVPQRKKTFRLSGEPVERSEWKGYVPTDMHHPVVPLQQVETLTEIFPDVFVLPPLERDLWLMGTIREMTLAVRIKDFGFVLVIGCGHPTVPRILEQARHELGEMPVAVVGGLHFPVDGSRIRKFGIPLQKYLGTGPRPIPTLKVEDAREAAEHLLRCEVKQVVLSGHDTSDIGIEVFREVLNDRLSIIQVGKTETFSSVS